jgi:CheY-like chemotaxis protein
MDNGKSTIRNIFLSDDDRDDCSLFSEALQELASDAKLTIASDGAKLMKALDENVPPAPELIFLDLNMPRKNGFECLQEIRKSPKFKDIPVIIFSTSNNNDVVDKTFQEGANFYITKPSSFTLLKKTLAFVLSIGAEGFSQPQREKFVIKVA